MKVAVLLLSLCSVSSALAAGQLYVVRCAPYCSWYALDPATGATTEHMHLPRFRTYVRPGIAAVADNGQGNEYLWSFPQAPQDQVFTYSPQPNRTGAITGLGEGVVSLQWGRSTLFAVVDPAGNYLLRKQLPSGPAEKLVSLGKYNVSGHEYVSALDATNGRLYITGDDPTAHSALMRTVHGVFGAASEVKVTYVKYTGWAMVRMQWNRASRQLMAVIQEFGKSSKLVSINPVTGKTTVITDFSTVIERAEFTIDHTANKGYVLAVPSHLYTIDLASGKVLQKVRHPINGGFRVLPRLCFIICRCRHVADTRRFPATPNARLGERVSDVWLGGRIDGIRVIPKGDVPTTKITAVPPLPPRASGSARRPTVPSAPGEAAPVRL
jgi:hypothetical protein